MPVVIVVGLVLGGLIAFAVQKAVQARRVQAKTGWEELVGEVGEVRVPLSPVGQVFVEGALWRARPADAGTTLDRGYRVRVESVDGLTLLVCTGWTGGCDGGRRKPRKERPSGSSARRSSAILVVLLFILLASAVRILREYERGVIFRLGRLIAQKGPGLILLIPIIDKMVRVDLRTVTLNVPPQEVITKDNVTVRVNAVAYFRVIDPNRAITEIENFLLATSQISQTTLRSVLGKAELDCAARRARAAQQRAAADHRRADRALGHQGEHGRGQGRRAAGRDAARDRAPGRGRARAARQDHRRRRRVPGRGEARPGGRRDQPEPGDAAASLPADAARDRRQPELDDRLPAADRHD